MDEWNSKLHSAEKRTVELEEKSEEVTQILAQSHEETANIKKKKGHEQQNETVQQMGDSNSWRQDQRN